MPLSQVDQQSQNKDCPPREVTRVEPQRGQTCINKWHQCSGTSAKGPVLRGSMMIGKFLNVED